MHMMTNAGATLPKDQIALAAKYLAKNFPEKQKPGAVARGLQFPLTPDAEEGSFGRQYGIYFVSKSQRC